MYYMQVINDLLEENLMNDSEKLVKEIKNDEQELEKAQWKKELKRKKNGEIRENSSYNARILLNYTPELKNQFRFNEFNRQVEKSKGIKQWGILPGQSYDDDVSVIGYHFEDKYNLVFPDSKIRQAILVEAKEHSFNPVKDWIEKKSWDGRKRAEKLFVDTLGADDTNYTHNVTRVFLLELVSRVYHPGSKCDIVPMLHSTEQGIGKSTILKNLCPDDDTFNDSLISLGMSKDDYDQIQGSLVVEIGELSAMKKTGIDRVKGFITSQSDKYREPYAHTATKHPRTCVFAGTTNQSEFLKDRTGNRRFALIECHGGKRTKSPFDGDHEYYQQILAEAKTWYDSGEKPVLSAETDAIAKEKAEAATIEDLDEQKIKIFLNMELPEVWSSLSRYQKNDYFIHRNDKAFSKQLNEKIKDNSYRKIESFTTVDCLQAVFGIDTDQASDKKIRELQCKIASVATSNGWKRTNIGPDRLKGYKLE